MDSIIIWHNGTPSAIRPEVAQQFGIERTTNLSDNPELYQKIIDAQNAAVGASCSMEDGCLTCGS